MFSKYCKCCKKHSITFSNHFMYRTAMDEALQPWDRRTTCWALWSTLACLVEAVVNVKVMPWPSRLDCVPLNHEVHGNAINRLSRLGTPGTPTSTNALLLLVSLHNIMGEWNVASRAAQIQVEDNSHFACILNVLWTITWVCVSQLS